jgi:hypothetical protein
LVELEQQSGAFLQAYQRLPYWLLLAVGVADLMLQAVAVQVDFFITEVKIQRRPMANR